MCELQQELNAARGRIEELKAQLDEANFEAARQRHRATEAEARVVELEAEDNESDRMWLAENARLHQQLAALRALIRDVVVVLHSQSWRLEEILPPSQRRLHKRVLELLEQAT